MIVLQTIILRTERLCDALRDLVPFVLFKNVKNTPPWVCFQVFCIVQMLPNRAKQHVMLSIDFRTDISKINFLQ